MDVVFIAGLRIETLIGVHEWEKLRKQAVILDLEMGTDAAQAAATDRIADALDYEAIANRLSQYLGQSRFDLLETLAERCSEILRDEFGVPWVRMRINKVGAIGQAREVGVVIERGRRG